MAAQEPFISESIIYLLWSRGDGLVRLSIQTKTNLQWNKRFVFVSETHLLVLHTGNA